MTSELAALLSWSFVAEITIPSEVGPMLVQGEQPWAAYRTIRDWAVVTNKRIIIADKQGLLGKKVQVYTIPFKSVNMFSVENCHGILDFDADVRLWTRAGFFNIGFSRGIDLNKFSQMVATAIL
jgi:Bacterial PH domain